MAECSSWQLQFRLFQPWAKEAAHVRAHEAFKKNQHHLALRFPRTICTKPYVITARQVPSTTVGPGPEITMYKQHVGERASTAINERRKDGTKARLPTSIGKNALVVDGLITTFWWAILTEFFFNDADTRSRAIPGILRTSLSGSENGQFQQK